MPKIVYVDGFRIRNTFGDLGEGDLDFNIIHGHGLSFFAPWFIPKDEIWIDKRFKDESQFLVKAEKLEQVLYKKIGRYWPSRWQTAKLLCRPSRKNYVWKSHRRNGIIVKLVNGGLVRRTFDPAFVMGGHFFVYSSYIPKGEIWLDAKLNPKELKYILIHEEYEYRLMKKGWDYDSAHKEACLVEKAARVRDKITFYPFINPLKQLPFIQTKSGQATPKVLILSGIHGDEQSGPLAIARFLLGLRLPVQRNNWDIIPLINPYGFEKGKHDDALGRNINRYFFDAPKKNEPAECGILRKFSKSIHQTYDFAVSIHEDTERRNFYLYDGGCGQDSPLITKVFGSVKQRKIGLFSGIDDINDPQLRNRVKNGYIDAKSSCEHLPTFEDYLLRNKKAKKVLVLEIPGRLKLEKRINLAALLIAEILKLPS